MKNTPSGFACMVTFMYDCEYNYNPKQRQISQKTMSYFGENADFITIHAGFLPLAQNKQKSD